MKKIFRSRDAWRIVLLAGFFFEASPVPAQTQPGKSAWVYPGADGKLSYKTLPTGDRIMDFSHAGYRGGGVAIPSPAVKITLAPAPGDNTRAIQQAIDSVSGMELVDGFRGAVLLSPGTYDCQGTLRITQSGVVLRGSGSGPGGTTIRMTGRPHGCIVIRGEPRITPVGDTTLIEDSYVPSGTCSFRVKNTRGFSVGDTIRILRPVTPAWVHFMGMDLLTRNGKKQTWITGTTVSDRVIGKIQKNRITVSVPLCDSYDARYLDPPGVSVVRITSEDLPSQIGIENLRIVSPSETGTITQRHNQAFSIRGITDGWARNIEILNTVNSISVTATRITLEKISITHEVPTTGAAKPADINGSGSQLLVDRCRIKGSNLFFFATGAKVSGPIVLLNCVFRDSGWIQPHQRWATGLLVDHCQVPDGGIDFMNRGAYGSGHGWAIGWAVAWNCTAKSWLNQAPPGSANWVIGCSGERQRKVMPFTSGPLLPEGIYDSQGTPVSPSSLYLAQLRDRLGEEALKNIGY